MNQDRRRSDSYRERILKAARQLFLEHGLDGVSMYMIARTAGIGQGSLYRRYADIGEIGSDLLRDNTEKLLSGLEALVAGPITQGERDSHSDGADQADEEGLHLERLRSAIAQVVDFTDEHAELLLRIKSEFTGKKQLTQFEHPIFEKLNGILTGLFRQAAQAGEIREVEPSFMGSALTAVLSPDLYLYQQKVHGSTKAEIQRGILTLVNALASK
ncbi:TetR/AcrR family transcriptional regulator [Paenibacillus phocaensis]|uniref:TetR/AcrR family transcriptional regulator n=1 Tax=Paenibacillus phocaensis TaxID=1776378 RepID=UPI000839B3F0|nr:TetR/AcrR family transcriptional regulator [Paenibacillus phocaensis]